MSKIPTNSGEARTPQELILLAEAALETAEKSMLQVSLSSRADGIVAPTAGQLFARAEAARQAAQRLRQVRESIALSREALFGPTLR